MRLMIIVEFLIEKIDRGEGMTHKKRIAVFLLIFSFIASHLMAANKAVVIPLTKKAIWTSNPMELQNVVTVSPSGADFTDPVAAVNAITDAGPENPYLVFIGPGVYTLNKSLIMKHYVSIKGAGEQATKLIGAISSDSWTHSLSAIIVGVDNASLSDLTIENTGGATFSIALYNLYSSSSINFVTAIASGGEANYGVYNSVGSPTLTNVTATASGGTSSSGVFNGNSSATLINVTATASYATNNYGVYNNSSATLSNVTATASYGTNNHGVYNYSGLPTLINVTATAHHGTIRNNGVYNCYSSPTLTFVTATGYGGTDSYGVFTSDSSTRVSSPTLWHSTLKGSTLGLRVGYGTARVMHSSIIGGVEVLDTGILSCVDSNNGDSIVLDANCEEL